MAKLIVEIDLPNTTKEEIMGKDHDDYFPLKDHQDMISLDDAYLIPDPFDDSFVLFKLIEIREDEHGAKD